MEKSARSQKFKKLIIVLPLILLAVLIIAAVLLYFKFLKGDSPQTSSTSILAEFSPQDAIAMIQAKYPEFNDYPSTDLPPRSIKLDRADRGWFIAFIQEGSGLPVISATCFLVVDQDNMLKIGDFVATQPINLMEFSLRTCK